MDVVAALERHAVQGSSPRDARAQPRAVARANGWVLQSIFAAATSLMTGEGPYGPIEMGGMFTIVEVRDDIKTYENAGGYKQPQGTSAYKLA
jgi:hypothetical protein